MNGDNDPYKIASKRFFGLQGFDRFAIFLEHEALFAETIRASHFMQWEDFDKFMGHLPYERKMSVSKVEELYNIVGDLPTLGTGSIQRSCVDAAWGKLVARSRHNVQDRGCPSLPEVRAAMAAVGAGKSQFFKLRRLAKLMGGHVRAGAPPLTREMALALCEGREFEKQYDFENVKIKRDLPDHTITLGPAEFDAMKFQQTVTFPSRKFVHEGHEWSFTVRCTGLEEDECEDDAGVRVIPILCLEKISEGTDWVETEYTVETVVLLNELETYRVGYTSQFPLFDANDPFAPYPEWKPPEQADFEENCIDDPEYVTKSQLLKGVNPFGEVHLYVHFQKCFSHQWKPFCES